MKSDKFWMSALWGRLGVSIILLVSAALRGGGVDVTQEQMDTAFSVIGNMIDNWYLVVGAVLNVVSKLREKRKSAAVIGQSGSARMMMVFALALFCALFLISGLAGCGVNQSATQQLLKKTDDPAIILEGAFGDAQDLYVEAAKTYLPYQQALQRVNPDLDNEIISWFRKANTILDDWERNGDVPVGDKEQFSEYLRQISIQLALMLEEKYQK